MERKKTPAASPQLGPLEQKAIEVMEITARLVARAKTANFSFDEWDELAELFDIPVFERVAANRETRNWEQDIKLRHQFALVCDFTYHVRRVAECNERVYIDVVETMIGAAETFSVNTLGVIEFNQAGKIFRSTTYQQWDADRVPTYVGSQE